MEFTVAILHFVQMFLFYENENENLDLLYQSRDTPALHAVVG